MKKSFGLVAEVFGVTEKLFGVIAEVVGVIEKLFGAIAEIVGVTEKLFGEGKADIKEKLILHKKRLAHS
jgi:rRNA processing protein Gar1